MIKRQSAQAMNRYLRDQKTGLYFSKEGNWDHWLNARLFDNLEVLLRTAFQIDQEELEIVVTFNLHEPTNDDISLPISRPAIERAVCRFTGEG